MNEIYKIYLDAGPEQFISLVTTAAPYAATIEPKIIALTPGYCEVKVDNHRAVQNQLGTIHAIALCNAAELAVGLLAEVSIPEDHRWIPEGMTTEYLAKARTDARVIADATDLDLSITGSVEIPVVAYDTQDKAVFRARIRINLKPKKPS
jgi:acyl-coenzyme A thioesterase PaaI-like protein